MSKETPAGRMARTMPELDSRERACLLAENQHRELARAACSPTADWLLSWERSAVRAITDRASDALEIARVKLCIDAFNEMRERPVAYSDCAAYWAALP